MASHKGHRHILFLAAWFPDEERPFYGAFVKEHAMAVARYDHVSILHVEVEKTRLPARNKVRSEILGPRCSVHRLTVRMPIRRFGFHDRKVKESMESVIRDIEELEGKVDLVHVHVRDHITKFAPELDSLKTLPMMLTEHWSFYHTGIHQLAPEEQTKRRKDIAAWFNLPQLRFICPVSQNLGGFLIRDFDAPEDRIRIIPNVANPVFHPSDKSGLSPSSIKITLAASWTPPKNPFLFLDALEQLNPEHRERLEITWIGGGVFMAEVERRVAEAGWQNITFTGFQSKDVVAKSLQEADLLVHPSDAENLPSIIIESISCGTPVLSHRVNGVPELVNDQNGVLCPPKEVSAFRDALENLIQNYSFDRKQIAKAAATRYSMAAVGKAYDDLYREILD